MEFIQGKCDVCGKKSDETISCCSSMGAITLCYCKDCYEKGLEPYGIMVGYIACAGKFPEDIHPTYQKEVRRILKELNISEKVFIKDVENYI